LRRQFPADGVPFRKEKPAQHGGDPPRAQLRQNALHSRNDDITRRAAKEIVIAALHDHEAGAGRHALVEAAQHAAECITRNTSIHDPRVVPAALQHRIQL
jgi:hypothetical protein